MRLSLEVCIVVTIKGHVRCLGIDDKKSSPKIVYSLTFKEVLFPYSQTM